jgi:FAD/FMN-containing dehydrogenase
MSSPLSQVILGRMGGAVERVPPDATAFPHRHARHLLWMVTTWRPDEDPEPQLAWARSLAEAVAPFAAGGVYVNALGDEPFDRVRSAYGANWDRLRQVKRAWDPENVFRLNANIPPAAPFASARS